MSVIQKASPLNLMGKVAIVTSASTPLGAQICRTLLRHNCLVLGIDKAPIPECERLFSSLGTHFQTLQLDPGDKYCTEHIVEHSKDRFWKQGFDMLITSGEDEHTIHLQREISHIMLNTGGGIVINLLKKDENQSLDPVELGPRNELGGVKANTVLLDCFANGGDWTMLDVPSQYAGIDEVARCMDRFRLLTKADADTNAEKSNKGVADLVLYLASDLGLGINGAVVTVHGRWRLL